MKTKIVFALSLVLSIPAAFGASDTTQYGTLSIDQDTITVPEDSMVIIQVSGTIQDYNRGTQLLLDISKPDGTSDQIKVTANQEGLFSTSIIIDANWSQGGHTIEGVYDGNTIGTVTFMVESIAGPKLPTFDELGTVEIEAEQFLISKGEKQTLDIFGNILDYQRGQPITIDILGPEGSAQSINVLADKYSGDYIAHIAIDDTWQAGVYEFKVTYSDDIVGTVDFTLNKIEIPQWVRNNAGWWAQGQIGDSDFVSGIQFLITSGIMQIPATEAGTGSSEIPQWVKNNAGWWADGSISDNDFVSGLKYLIENGILVV